MLSGIGLGEQLEAHGIPVLQDSPGVGQNLQEYPGTQVKAYVNVKTPNQEFKRVDAVRSELDDWIQCEHDRQAMSDAVFFDLYYGENSTGGKPETGERHVKNLRLARSMLAQHYPDCAPLRDLMGKIDLAVAWLEKMGGG